MISKQILSVILTLFSCHALGGQEQSSVRVFNLAVQDALKNHDAFLHEPRNVLELSSGATARNCFEYINNSLPRTIGEEVNEQIIYQEYLICDTVEAIRNMTDNKEYASASENRGETIGKNLDLRSFPSSMGPKITDEKFTLATLAKDAIKTLDNSVEIDNQEWIYKLEVIAAGDFNSNQKEDWLLWLTDESKVGNYRDYGALIVYDPGFDEMIKAEYPPLPRKEQIIKQADHYISPDHSAEIASTEDHCAADIFAPQGRFHIILDLPLPCEIHRKPNGSIVTFLNQGEHIILVENSRPHPDLPNDCLTKIQAITLGNGLTPPRASEAVATVAACRPYQWDAKMYIGLFK